MSTNIAVLLGLFRVSDLKLNKKKLENCGAFVIYLLNSAGIVEKFERFYDRIGCANCKHMSTNVAVLLGSFRVSDLKLKKKLENCGAFVIYH